MGSTNDANNGPDTGPPRAATHEWVVTRRFDAELGRVFAAWATPALFKEWWVLKSSPVTLLSCEMDVRTGGAYRLVYGQGSARTMAFYGKYREVIPNARLVWTNEEGEDGAVTRVDFQAIEGATMITFRETYPSKEALDRAGAGMDGMLEAQFAQLDDLLSR